MRSTEQKESPSRSRSPITLTRADLDESSGPPLCNCCGVEWLLSHTRELRIDSRLNSICAQWPASSLPKRAKMSDDRQAPRRIYHQNIRGFQTTYGDLTRDDVEKVESVRRRAATSIFSCRDHTIDRCRCWAFARTALYEIRAAMGEERAWALRACVWKA